MNLNSTTLFAAYTTISKRVDQKVFSDLEWRSNGDIDWQNAMLQELSERIYKMIEEYKQSKSEFLLTKIFIWIQLWGGNSGRQIFVKSGGWPDNFEIKTYTESVGKIQSW